MYLAPLLASPLVHHGCLLFRYFILQVILEPAGSSTKKAKTAKGAAVSASDKVLFIVVW